MTMTTPTPTPTPPPTQDKPTDSDLLATAIANFNSEPIQRLITQRGWRALSAYERIGAAYDFVRNEVAFGYNRADDLTATDVLADGYGQCNTKGNLLIAMLRGLGIPSRFHGFTIHKGLQRGAIPWWLYRLAPRRILHSWVEVWHDGGWIPLEGFILDADYLRALQRRFATAQGPFCGYGAATSNLQRPDVDWEGRATYIQKDGIVDDFGLFDSPDAFYAKHGTNLRGLRRLMYVWLARHAMNRVVARIRRGGAAAAVTMSG